MSDLVNKFFFGGEDYFKSILTICLNNFEYNEGFDVYNLKEIEPDKLFVDYTNKRIKELKEQLKQVKSLTDDEVSLIVEAKNQTSADTTNKMNEESILLREHLESLGKRILDWNVGEDKNMIHLKNELLTQINELLVYKCVMSKPLIPFKKETYKQNTIERIELTLKQQKELKKDYLSRIKETNKMTELLNKYLPALMES